MGMGSVEDVPNAANNLSTKVPVCSPASRAAAGQEPKRLIVYGAGGHGLVVAEAAVAAGLEVLGFV